MKTIFSLIFWSISFGFIGQATTYNDVAVIVNDNSQESIAIGNYFKTARNIPNQNIIHIAAPTTEEIDSTQFEQIRSQIESYLVANDLQDSINYLVTTKGVPLKRAIDCFSNMPAQSCASFDSELALILGTYASQIGLPNSIANPFYNVTDHFSRSDHGIYLVTRLDGYTTQDVFDLIDRSGPLTSVDQASVQNIVDLNAVSASADSAYFMSNFLTPSYDFFTSNSWNTQLDVEFDIISNQDNVFCYIFGGQPITNQTLNNTWTDGSIALLSSGQTAITFDSSNNPENILVAADLIAEGCTGVYGNVNFIYFSDVLNTEIFVNRYLNETENYNLAESFYMAESDLSWQNVIVGDPKASIVIENLASLKQINAENIRVYPNPTADKVTIETSEPILSVSILDLKGSTLKKSDLVNTSSTVFDLNGIESGTYIILIDLGNTVLRETIVINK